MISYLVGAGLVFDPVNYTLLAGDLDPRSGQFKMRAERKLTPAPGKLFLKLVQQPQLVVPNAALKPKCKRIDVHVGALRRALKYLNVTDVAVRTQHGKPRGYLLDARVTEFPELGSLDPIAREIVSNVLRAVFASLGVLLLLTLSHPTHNADDWTVRGPGDIGGERHDDVRSRHAQRFTRAFVEDVSRARLASFEGVAEANRTALNVLTTTRFLVNQRVAEISGAPYSGTGLQPVDVGTLPDRVGIMTHPGVIAGMGGPSTGSFVDRGKYLIERLSCRNPITFPAELLADLQTFNVDTTGLNEHERVAIRKTRPEGWSCQVQFEPFAFGFSRFDGSGVYVGETDAAGKPLPLDGWVPTLDEASSPHYTNVRE